MRPINKIILFAALTLSVSSCNKWLDVTPEDTTVEKDLFSTFGGYHSAINGLYQTIAGPEFYGQNLTWGFASALSQNYDNSTTIGKEGSLAYAQTEKYNFKTDEVEGYAAQIWETGYNVIANCNNILQHIDVADPTIFPNRETGEIEMIKGEALAVRALVHFEILRLFADAPVVSMSAKAIPYSSVYPDKFTTRYTTEQVLTKIVADLVAAEKLLSTVDYSNVEEGDITNYLQTGSRYTTSSISGIFFGGRGVRMNALAVESLLARVYAYGNDLENANKYATLAYEAATKDNYYKYTDMSTNLTQELQYHRMVSELTIAFYSMNVTNDYINSNSMSLNGLEYGSSTNSYVLKNVDQMFDAADVDDVRRTKLISSLDSQAKFLTSVKYQARNEGASGDVTGAVENNLIGVMRLSELRFIMAEYLVSQGDVASAVTILNDHRVKRGCVARGDLPADMTKDEFMAELDKEVWRESFSEGQYFFYCKRINAETINNKGIHVPMSGKYTLGIPDSEISLN